MPKYLVAMQTAYEIVGREGETITTICRAGTNVDAYIGREFVFTRSEVRCNVAAGVIRITDSPPVKPVTAKKKSKALWKDEG